MTFEDEGNSHRASATGFRLMRTYSRTVGVIQLLCASLFGWMASGALSFVVQQEGGFKGSYIPPISYFDLYQGTIWAQVSFTGFIGGCGLVGLRAWARPWEIMYLFVVSLLAIERSVIDAGQSRVFGPNLLFYLFLALPYLPFLFVPTAFRLPPVGRKGISGRGPGDLDEPGF